MHTKTGRSRLLGVLTSCLMAVTAFANFGDTVPRRPVATAAEAGPIGYAAGTTGGAGGNVVTVATGDQFLSAVKAKGTAPLTIYVNGTITLDNTAQDELLLKDLSDLSVIGVDTAGECDGIGIRMVRCENIIIQNMEIHHVKKGAGEGDAISIETSRYVWVDHCELYSVYDGNESNKDVYDGLLDCKKDSANLTYSYNYLHDSWKTMLCGFSDSDNFDRTFTIHHNVFENCNSRLPLFRFGHAHIYNNYYHSIYTSAINTRMGAEVLVENNVFDTVKEPVCSLDSDVIGYWNLRGNVFHDCTSGNTSNAAEQSWREGMANTSTYQPPYAYQADSTDTLAANLQASVGVGKLGGSVPIPPEVTTTTTAPLTTTTTVTTQGTVIPPQPIGDAIYCAPNASASGTGTLQAPMSVEQAIATVQPGGRIYCLEGVYAFASTLKIAATNNGTADAYKTISAYPGAKVIFDFSALPVASSSRGVSMEGSYWHWYGIQIRKAGDNGMLLAGHYNKLELCVFRDNQDTGLQLSRGNTAYTSISQWPTGNLILNCTACNNCDDATMENADGFAAKLTCGEGNVFDGCMSYNNSDDGWDLYAKSETGPIGKVTIRNCIAFRNGWTEDGRGYGDCDGNGFKLGGAGVGTAHVVENCIAFENLHHGFTDNNNPDFGSLLGCTAYANAQGGGKANFQMDRCNAGNFRNLLSYAKSGCGSDKFNGTLTNGLFYNSSKYYRVSEATQIANSKAGTAVTGPTDADFVSVTAPQQGTDFHTVWRNADGSVNLRGFLTLQSGSTLQGLGAVFSAQEPPVVTTTTSTLTTTTTTTTGTPVSMRGDVNVDEKINIADLVILARYVAEDPETPITAQGVANADCDGDGKINAQDMTTICRYLAHLISEI